MGGFPPKICAMLVTQLFEEKSQFSEGSTCLRSRCQILDVGCGKGFIGQYLRTDGFRKITGMDLSSSLLQIAAKKNVYQKLENVALGLEKTGSLSKISPEHNQKY